MPKLKSILLVTVPHTGTRFVLKLLEQQYYHQRHHIMRDHTERRPLQRHLLASCHTEYPGLVMDYVRAFKPIIVTCQRDEAATFASFVKRKGDGAEQHYQKQLAGAGVIWKGLKPHFVISIDAPDREERLASLANELGVPLVADWNERVGNWETRTPNPRGWPLCAP